MKKIYLDGLPKRGNKQINWNDSIGHRIEFIYGDIEGEVEILEYENSYLKIKYGNSAILITPGHFASCKLGALLGKRLANHIHTPGSVIENVRSGRLKIIENITLKHRKTNRKGYHYECLDCGNRDNIEESHLKEGNGCNVCSSRKTLIGHNDLWTTHPKVASLLDDPNEGFKYTGFSHNKVNFRCPDCDHLMKKSIAFVSKMGLCCSRCSDGVSYPEKFIISMFSQMPYEYATQMIFEWSKKIMHNNPKLSGDKKYDGYLPHINKIIEIHGAQHFEKDFGSRGERARSVKEEKENDFIKTELANKNGYSVIIIDARISDFHYMKDSILKSELSELINLNYIDWNQCHEHACSSFIKICSDLWNAQTDKDINRISSEMGLDRSTVRRYLKQGAQIGICDYNIKSAILGAAKIRGRKIRKSIVRLSLDDTYIDEYDSATEVRNILGISKSSVCEACSGKRNSAGGFKWMYKEDYERSIAINA